MPQPGGALTAMRQLADEKGVVFAVDERVRETLGSPGIEVE